MKVHLVRIDELAPGDLVAGTDAGGAYADGTRELLKAEHVEGADSVRLVWTDGTPVEYSRRTMMLVDRGR